MKITKKSGALLLLSTFYFLLSGMLAFALPTDEVPADNTNPPPIALINTNLSGNKNGQTNLSDFHLTPDCDATLAPNAPPGPNGPPCDIRAFVNWVKKIINYLFYISVPIATAFILWGAFVMMKSGGSPGEFEKGKKVILSAIIGIVIIFTSNLIVTTIANILGAKIPTIP